MRIPILTLAGALAICAWSAACGSGQSDAPASGEALYATQGCATCHGPSGDGTALGPTLADAASHWQRPALIEYLKNPKEYAAKDARLSQQSTRYSLTMPTYQMLTPAQLEALADFVLTRR